MFLPPDAHNYVCASGCKKYTLELEQQELFLPVTQKLASHFANVTNKFFSKVNVFSA